MQTYFFFLFLVELCCWRYCPYPTFTISLTLCMLYVRLFFCAGALSQCVLQEREALEAKIASDSLAQSTLIMARSCTPKLAGPSICIWQFDKQQQCRAVHKWEAFVHSKVKSLSFEFTSQLQLMCNELFAGGAHQIASWLPKVKPKDMPKKPFCARCSNTASLSVGYVCMYL